MAPKPNKALSSAEAHGLWDLYGFSSPKELMLEDLAMALGIVVIDGRLDSAAARLVRSGDTGIVRISHRIREPGRRRFAIAHEIGHWQMHRNQSHLLACTDEDMLARYGASTLEVEASVFAGSLLMPEHLFIERVNARRPTPRVINDLCDYFGTTLTATALRYVEISNDYYVFVLSENNRIRWWRASDAFGDHELWIENKTVLPRNSAAASFFRGEAVPVTPQHVDLSAWLGDLPGIDSETIIEQAFPLASYGQVISILWLPS
jgi:Zn-dependent peptidase ImmA (M78 family)